MHSIQTVHKPAAVPRDLPLHPMLKRVIAFMQCREKEWVAILELHNAHTPYSTHRVFDNGECLSGTYHGTLPEAIQMATDRWREARDQ